MNAPTNGGGPLAVTFPGEETIQMLESEAATIPGFTGRFVEANGVRLFCRLGGDPAGPPVLLWHGFLGTGYVWRKVAPLLSARGCAVLAPDMRGYGDSDKPPGPDGYDGLGLAADFRALVQELGFGDGRPLTLVAHDMGAPAALLWAHRHPDEVAGLAYLEEPVLLPEILGKLIAYTPEGTRLGGLWWWMMALAPGMAERLVEGGRERAFLEWSYEHYALVQGAVEPAAVDEYLRSFAAPGGVAGAFGIYRAVPRTVEQTAPLAQDKLRVPVLALGGEGSMGTGLLDMMRRVAERVEGGVLPGCGHFVPEEQPEELVHQLAALVPGLRP